MLLVLGLRSLDGGSEGPVVERVEVGRRLGHLSLHLPQSHQAVDFGLVLKILLPIRIVCNEMVEFSTETRKRKRRGMRLS